MAPYKKKPKDLAPIWSSSMKAVFWWCQALPEHGLPAGRHRFFVAPAAGPRFRRFPVFASPPKGNGLRFTPSFTAIKTSGLRRWSGFCANCLGICGAMLSFFGMAADPTRGPWLKSFLKNIQNFISNGFPGMRRNSTLTSLSGTCSKDLWRTGLQRMSISLNAFCFRNLYGCGAQRNCSGPAYMHRICHGPSFYYLCVSL